MGVFSHFIAASALNKTPHFEELESFITHLLQEQIVQLPAAIFVGEARNEPRGNDYHGISYAYEYIVPNSPYNMLDLRYEEDFPTETCWYYGDDEDIFREALHGAPLGEKDICICFYTLHPQLAKDSWEGAVIYILTRPFPTDFIDPWDTSPCPLIDRDLAHFFTLTSSVGGYTTDFASTTLKTILEQHFGADLTMKQTFEPQIHTSTP